MSLGFDRAGRWGVGGAGARSLKYSRDYLILAVCEKQQLPDDRRATAQYNFNAGLKVPPPAPPPPAPLPEKNRNTRVISTSDTVSIIKKYNEVISRNLIRSTEVANSLASGFLAWNENVDV